MFSNRQKKANPWSLKQKMYMFGLLAFIFFVFVGAIALYYITRDAADKHAIKEIIDSDSLERRAEDPKMPRGHTELDNTRTEYPCDVIPVVQENVFFKTRLWLKFQNRLRIQAPASPTALKTHRYIGKLTTALLNTRSQQHMIIAKSDSQKGEVKMRVDRLISTAIKTITQQQELIYKQRCQLIPGEIYSKSTTELENLKISFDDELKKIARQELESEELPNHEVKALLEYLISEENINLNSLSSVEFREGKIVGYFSQNLVETKHCKPKHIIKNKQNTDIQSNFYSLL